MEVDNGTFGLKITALSLYVLRPRTQDSTLKVRRCGSVGWGESTTLCFYSVWSGDITTQRPGKIPITLILYPQSGSILYRPFYLLLILENRGWCLHWLWIHTNIFLSMFLVECFCPFPLNCYKGDRKRQYHDQHHFLSSSYFIWCPSSPSCSLSRMHLVSFPILPDRYELELF